MRIKISLCLDGTCTDIFPVSVDQFVPPAVEDGYKVSYPLMLRAAASIFTLQDLDGKQAKNTLAMLQAVLDYTGTHARGTPGYFVLYLRNWAVKMPDARWKISVP